MYRKQLGIALASFLLPVAAIAAPPNSQVMALQQQIAAIQIDHALNLTQQQAQALLPILQNAKAQVQSFQAQRTASEPALVAALTQAVSDLQTGGTISGATAQAVNAARTSPATLRDSMRPVWQQAKQILAPEQLQALRNTQLGVPRTGTANAQEGGPVHRFGRRFRLMHTLLSDAFISLVQARAG